MTTGSTSPLPSVQAEREHAMMQPDVRRVVLAAAPAMLVALALLIPFLNNAYTIDDPLFLREAEHALHDPLHPTAFSIVWNQEVSQRASAFLPGGPLVPFLLFPVVLGGEAEWIGHALQILFLVVTACANAALALRCGLTRREASVAALIVVTAPAVLGMAGTVMPDIASMMFATLALERLIAWRELPSSGRGIAALFWITAAALTRFHLVLLIIPAAILVAVPSWRSWKTALRAALPPACLLCLPVFIVFAVLFLTRDPQRDSELDIVGALRNQMGIAYAGRNGMAFLADWLYAVPVALAYVLARVRRMPGYLWWCAAAVLLAALIRSREDASVAHWIVRVAVLTAGLMLADLVRIALREWNRTKLFLTACLFAGAAAIPYLHLPCKYLIPSAPAAAILLMMAVRGLPRAYSAAILALTICFGATYGLLVLQADRALADSMRVAAVKLVVPRVQAGQKVWYAGQWGFHWYAERAGATPLALNGPFPRPGDVVVVSRADAPGSLRVLPGRRLLLVTSDHEPGGRIMDREENAGFFSNYWGYLPWSWGEDETHRFEVWEVE